MFILIYAMMTKYYFEPNLMTVCITIQGSYSIYCNCVLFTHYKLQTHRHMLVKYHLVKRVLSGGSSISDTEKLFIKISTSVFNGISQNISL